ncbi:MAG TPA: hypothetical protein GXX34_02475 [Clostridia bacterium]|nr:hypothetical protein [Clostridia bacterium]
MSNDAKDLLRRLRESNGETHERNLPPALEEEVVHIMPAGYPEHMSKRKGEWLHLILFLFVICLLFALWKHR